MALKTNEGTVCDAIVRHLETRTGAVRTDLWQPEKQGDSEVELAWKLGNQQFVIEHTVIEPFEDFLRLNAQAKAHFDPIIAACNKLLPDVLELEVPARCMQDLSKEEVAAAQAGLIAHVQATAPNMRCRRYSDYIGADEPTTIDDVPFPFRLFRFENLGIEPRLQIKHLAPDLAKQRAERIQRACDDKFPKLAAWKKKGARTIPVLEDNDIQLTNPATVTEVFVPVARHRDDAPDETYMVATCLDPWQLWPLLVDGRSYFDLAKFDLARNVPIARGELSWITAKRRG
jgi:hypothetical protein